MLVTKRRRPYRHPDAINHVMPRDWDDVFTADDACDDIMHLIGARRRPALIEPDIYADVYSCMER